MSVILKQQTGWEKVNSGIIPAKGSATSGAEYSFVDANVKNGLQYKYKLEDIDNSGRKTTHKEVSATPRWIFGFKK